MWGGGGGEDIWCHQHGTGHGAPAEKVASQNITDNRLMKPKHKMLWLTLQYDRLQPYTPLCQRSEITIRINQTFDRSLVRTITFADEIKFTKNNNSVL